MSKAIAIIITVHESSHSSLLHLCLSLNELQCLFNRHGSYRADTIRKSHSITLLSHSQHLRTESSAYELSTLVFVDCRRQLVEMLSHCCSILCVEIGVNLIEQVERRGITCLDGEDQCQGAQTYTGLVGSQQCGRSDSLFCPPDNCWIRCWSSCLLLNDTLIPTPI
jgi:hypothetical protein